MSKVNPEIERCKQFQQYVFYEVSKQFEKSKPFEGKTVSIAFCDDLVMKDLDELYDIRHFNFKPSLMMKSPNPDETIPLGVCMYLDRLPVAYAIGDISVERNAFEVHFIETSNFYGNSGLKVWLKYLINILLSLRDILYVKGGIDIRKICIVNPITSTIGALAEMKFDFTHDYVKSMSASILHLQIR